MITPKVWTRALVILLLIGAALFLIAGWNSIASHIPFTAQWRANRAETQRDIAQHEGTAAKLEAKGQADQIERVETYHTRVEVIRDRTAQAQAEAREAPDATQPLDPARVDRLRRHDDGLCASSPAICPPASPDAS